MYFLLTIFVGNEKCIIFVFAKTKLKFNIMKKINDTLFNSWLYIAYGIIVDFFEQNVYPSVHDIKDNWRYRYNNIHITDSAIEKIIENVSKYYN